MTTLTNQAKHRATLSTLVKHAASLTNQIKAVVSFLLKEDAFYILLETGDKIVLEPNTGFFPANEVKH